MSELTVDTSAMRAHARAVEGIAARLSEAADASATAAMPDASFGLLCAFLLPPATLVQTLAAGSVQAAATAMEGIATTIGGSADAYDAIDGAVHDALSRITKALS
ncbi:hypothetical protein Cch01nite_32680 [Cellulomonas chitinilytica]|uniref:ESX-1 secretion-associated protein n=1 Tax=Cellulomonas chitinilytica TaxID=398759 RepID=A0A919P7U8_9CELL|nr:type VII secretion target [Cellulomonas chitinilytica]GIG22544.1 hypothetical protein Cch01nite_32680 [Cellulomonas chitinilytica]